jgi:hypothetical protein
MAALRTFIRQGLVDADRRLSRIFAARPVDDRWVVETIERSYLYRVVAAVGGTVARAAATSWSLRAVRAVVERWTATPSGERRRAAGVMLVVAVFTHVALRFWQGHEPGWLWTVLPSVAAAIGLLLIVTSRQVAGHR